jgi:membrane protein DedA with SNARE-associated domain
METAIGDFFAHYAYYPFWIYGGILFFMLASGFGLPLPEEVVLLSSGFIGYMALNPDQYPPPSPDSPVVNVYVLASVAFLAVILSDYLIFFLGQRYGLRILRSRFFSRLIKPTAVTRMQKWIGKYGYFACVVFRFTPGLRFPGHLMCGAMGLSPIRFLMIDGTAALLTVPTQVLLLAFYGKDIMHYLRQFKIFLLVILAIGLLIYLVRNNLVERRKLATISIPPSENPKGNW